MPIVIFLAYIFLEALTFWAVSQLIGVGWTLLALFAFLIVGMLIAGIEMRQVARAAITGQRSAGRTAVDYGLITAGSIGLAAPGFLTSLLGLILILPPTRALVRAGLARKAQRWVAQLGEKGFETAAKYRPETSYGSFADPNRASQPKPIVIDEDELSQWTENVEPSDFDDDNKRGGK